MNRLEAVSFFDLGGWREDTLAEALAAFQRSARELIEQGHGFKRESQFGGTRQDWLPVAQKALAANDARAFFETEFTPCRAVSDARPLFTGYYEPLLQGAIKRSAEFNVPIYSKPADLVAFTPEEQQATGLSYGRRINSQPAPYFARTEIEQGALAGQGLELCYVNSAIDAFFMQVQGQGRVHLQEGGELRLSYAAKNGHAYRSIGKALIERGVGTPETMSMQMLRGWMAAHATEVQGLLRENPSFVFFRVTDVADATLGAIGAAKVHLTRLRSLAVDRAFWAFGTPLYVETRNPPEADAAQSPIRRLMVAQDTGSAIKGLVRGDIYWGWGEEAALYAGHMKQPGTLTALLPNALAKRLTA